MNPSLQKNVVITCIAILIGIALCTLGFNPATEPIDSIAVIWPGTLLHTVGAILFGGWGIIATVLSAAIVDMIKVGTVHVVLGYTIPDFLQSFIPALYYRKMIKTYGWSSQTFRFFPYFIVCVLLSNLAGAISGAFIFNFGPGGLESLWFPMTRWFIANTPVALILGWPLFRCLGPVMAEEGLTVNGWWK